MPFFTLAAWDVDCVEVTDQVDDCVDSEDLMLALHDSLSISNDPACTSNSYEPRDVLIAMGLSEDEANESVRFSWTPGIDSVPGDVIVLTIDDMCFSL